VLEAKQRMTDYGSDAKSSVAGRSPLPRASRLRLDLPLSVALGGGGVRGMAHIGVLEVLLERGFHITELVGTSVGALIVAYYAAVGLDVATLEKLGLSLTSRQLISWGLLRRAPSALQVRLSRCAGIIPEYVERLSLASWHRLHHGVERIGFVVYDPLRGEEILCHSAQRSFRLDDAARGAAALPGLFPPMRCRVDGETRLLVDGGVTNPLPVDALFTPPFAPVQVLAIDIGNRERAREANAAKVRGLRERHPRVPIELIRPDTLGKATVLYRTRGLRDLVDAGRRAAEALVFERGAACEVST
jgi:NTE family protein